MNFDVLIGFFAFMAVTPHAHGNRVKRKDGNKERNAVHGVEHKGRRLEKSWKRRTDESRRKALDAIESLKKKNAPVNFNSVQKESGVSKHYLYEHEEIRTIIEKKENHS